MKCMQYKGYIGSIEVEFDDNILHGKLLHIRDLVTYEAATPEELQSAFEKSVDLYLADCRAAGEEADTPCKGSFNVRISPELHRELAVSARQLNSSLNDYVSATLSKHRDFMGSPSRLPGGASAYALLMSHVGERLTKPEIVSHGVPHLQDLHSANLIVTDNQVQYPIVREEVSGAYVTVTIDSRRKRAIQ